MTGAGGFVGRHVVDELEDSGAEVIALTHRWSDLDEVEKLIDDRAVDWCAHLGWYADPRDYLVNRDENLRSLNDALALVELLDRAGCRHLVVAGSSAEYAPSAEVLDEEATIAPWSVYGAAKASLRLLLSSSALPPSMTLAWARLFNITGPGEHPHRLLPSVTRSMVQGEPMDLTTGEQVRDFLDVADVASAIVALGSTSATGTFNICSGTGQTLHSIISAIADRLDARDLARFGARPIGAHDPRFVVGDAGRLHRATGWQPRFDTAAMITRVVDHWTEIEQDAGTAP